MDQYAATTAIAVLAGWWCPLGVPIRLKLPKRPLGDPPPPGPDIIGQVLGALGGGGAWLALGPALGADTGILGTAVVGFLGGAFLVSLGQLAFGVAQDRPTG